MEAEFNWFGREIRRLFDGPERQGFAGCGAREQTTERTCFAVDWLSTATASPKRQAWLKKIYANMPTHYTNPVQEPLEYSGLKLL